MDRVYVFIGSITIVGFFKKLFGMEKPANAEVNPAPAADATDPETGGEVAPERMGVNGEYDQSGLAKRVAIAFDEDASVTDVDTLWVAQTGSSVVLKGSVPSQDILDKMVELASGVSGASDVNIDQVTVG
ncbi:putative phospholipid-binding protein [Chamaesiphon minutus PCC 6605]|uniref:Putative phospholipid-binding protein n=1 Tax=Chamaesiphon minutus (strain ATCC 27169 / PCC 6605) TaxID=1173020 RepID=K9UAQ9_CHAP6|nr:putative phospholipid-binding protein [Chamaesiphon minutus PCC 6605]